MVIGIFAVGQFWWNKPRPTFSIIQFGIKFDANRARVRRAATWSRQKNEAEESGFRTKYGSEAERRRSANQLESK